jgi:hypothetical protein
VVTCGWLSRPPSRTPAAPPRGRAGTQGTGSGHPKCPAAYVKFYLGIVSGAQQSTEISNWFQDEIIAMANKSLPEAKVGAKVLGVSYQERTAGGRNGRLGSWEGHISARGTQLAARGPSGNCRPSATIYTRRHTENRTGAIPPPHGRICPNGT